MYSTMVVSTVCLFLKTPQKKNTTSNKKTQIENLNLYVQIVKEQKKQERFNKSCFFKQIHQKILVTFIKDTLVQ